MAHLSYAVQPVRMYRESSHGKNTCAMYDLCGNRPDGKELNCPDPSPAVTVRFLICLVRLQLSGSRLTEGYGCDFSWSAWCLVSVYSCQCGKTAASWFYNSAVISHSSNMRFWASLHMSLVSIFPKRYIYLETSFPYSQMRRFRSRFKACVLCSLGMYVVHKFNLASCGLKFSRSVSGLTFWITLLLPSFWSCACLVLYRMRYCAVCKVVSFALS